MPDLASATSEPLAGQSAGTVWIEGETLDSLNVVVDLVTAGVYFAVPVATAFLVWRRRDLAYRPVFLLFAGVFLSFGLIHLVEAVTASDPPVRLLTGLRIVTAAISAVALASLLRVLPRMLALPTLGEVEELVDEVEELSDEVDELNEEVEELTDDVADAKQVAREAAAAKQRLSLAMEGASIGAWLWDVNTDDCEIDARGHGLIGLEPDTIDNGKAYFRFVHPSDRDRLRAAVERTVEDCVDLDDEFRVIRPDGTEAWLATKARPLRMEPHVLVGVNFDITAVKRHEAELAEAKLRAEAASQAKGEFLANMSHEIRTPLSAVLGCSDLLYPKLESEEQREMLQTIRRQGRLLLELLNDILDLSKIEAGKLDIHSEPCDLRAIVSDVGSLMGSQAGMRGLALDVEFAESVPEAIELDPLRMRQILLNLIGNAIKFTEVGSVSVQVTSLTPQQAAKAGRPPAAIGTDGELLIRIDDTGTGIPDTRLNEIFQAFQQADGSITRRYGGTGLGLTICQRLVSMMNGSLEVDSKVGVGSTFTVRVPLIHADSSVDSPAAIDVPVSPEVDTRLPLRVLLAEDTRTIRFMLERMLDERVECVESVSNGEEALRAAEAAVEAGQPFDLILMDMQMPVLDGFDAVSRLRQGGYRGRVYAVSAGASPDEHRRALQAGCDAQIDKPIDLAKLDRMLQDVSTQLNATR